MGRSCRRLDCCGTCKYKQHDAKSNELVCGNVDSDNVGLVIQYSEFCFDWEAEHVEV